MTGKEAFEQVLNLCDNMEKTWEKRTKDPQQKGIIRGIKLVRAGVEQLMEWLPEEEEENVQS